MKVPVTDHTRASFLQKRMRIRRCTVYYSRCSRFVVLIALSPKPKTLGSVPEFFVRIKGEDGSFSVHFG